MWMDDDLFNGISVRRGSERGDFTSGLDSLVFFF